MTKSTKNKENTLRSGFSGRLHRWTKDEHAVGLDVHDGRIVASHFIERKGTQVLNVLATQAYDPALSEKELAHCIRSFWKKNRLPTRTVSSCFYSSSLIVRSFSYSNVLRDELPRVLSLEAEEALQLPLDQISLTWHLNSQSNHESGIAGIMVAAPRRTVKNHIRLIKAAGLYPINVEIACSAVVNLYDFLNASAEAPPAPVCLINLAAQMAGIVILSGEAAYPRIIFSSNQTGWQNNLKYLASSIESALLQYQLKIKGDPVGKLLLAGYPRQDNFVERLSAAMSIPVEIWSPYEQGQIPQTKHIKKVLSPGEASAINLAAGLGLGLRHPKREL